MKATLHSHTHCQVTQAKTQAKTCQRMYLSYRSTDRQTVEEKEAQGVNRPLAKVAVQSSADTFVVNQNLVFRNNICGDFHHLRQAPKR